MDDGVPDRKPGQRIRILHVDDNPEFGDLVATFLEREDDAFDVVTETDPQDALAVLTATDIDCIVSDYDMPGADGLDLLDAVRRPYPDIPFILFTGKGSEEIASEAITRGVTDYLQKGSGTEQYEVLANRIRNSVGRYRTEHELERSRQFLDRVLDLSPAAVIVLDEEGGIIRSNELAREVLGLSGAELAARSFNDTEWQIVDSDGDPVPDDALPFRQVRDTGTPVHNIEHGIRRPDGEIIWLSINAGPLWDETDSIEHVVAVLSNESHRKTQERHQAETIRQLEAIGRVLSHDLGNILQISQGRLELARETDDKQHLAQVEESLDRAVDMLTDLTDAIQAGSVVDETTTVAVDSVFERALETQETPHATGLAESDIHVRADETALLRIFENLVRNAVEHGSTSPRSHTRDDAVEHSSTSPRSHTRDDAVEHGSTSSRAEPDDDEQAVETVTVRVGSLADGFYVEDDGPGILAEDRKQVFEAGHTSKPDGTGIGLPSVQQIARAHGWEVRITDGSRGGARFEFTNVDRPN